MAKGKAKINSSVSSAPPQPRSLRSRKREHPSDDISKTEDIQAALHHQDTEGNNPAADATVLQGHQSSLQESSLISPQQHQAAEQSCLTKQGPAIEEKHAEAKNVYLKDETVKDFAGQEETIVTNPNNDSQLEGFGAHTDNDANKNNEEITAEDASRPSSETCSDHVQVFLPTSEEDVGSCATSSDEQLGAKENYQCNLERNQEASDVYMADVKEKIKKEAAAGLPAKKKRRMGMCGLTEKERSHFLQTQKRENGQNGSERVEKQICKNTADLVAQEDLPSSLSIPVGNATEQTEAKINLVSSHCEGDDRAETEVRIVVTTSDGTSTVCDPCCSKGKRCEAEGGIACGLEQPGDTKSDPPAEEEIWGNQEQQELEEHTAEIMPQRAHEQVKEGQDGPEVVIQSPATALYSKSTQNEETKNLDAIETALLQVKTVTRTRDEKKEELTRDAGDADGAEAGASSTDYRSARFNCGSVELCGAAVTPSGSERNDSHNPDDEPCAGPSTVNTEPPQARDTTDLFGSGYLDYVSDSQLNAIALIEEEVMEIEGDLGTPDCHEDATDLICGLIRELSSLNRKVMATHREMENLRRSSKSSRGSIR